MKRLCFNCMKVFEDSTVCPYCRCADQTARAPHHIKPGSRLGNRYIIGRSLGEGGFGITYIGFDERLSRRVAIKEYYPSGAANRNNSVDNTIVVTQSRQDIFRRGKSNFIEEARAVARFTNEEGIVDVYDSFEANNTAYIIMEYLEGITLKQYLNRNGTMKADSLISLMMPVMKSLKTMHDQKIIHRDISPDNIMYTSSGKLKLMDFGSARYFANEERELSVILKHGYAPEEQYRSNSKQGPYTDVYSLCATIYACITGRPPADSIERIINDRVRTPSQLGFEISPVQENALMHGLAVSADRRCPDMQSLINEFSGSYFDGTRTVSAESEYYGERNSGVYNRRPDNYDDYYNRQNQYITNNEQQKSRSNLPIVIAISVSIIVITGLVAAILIMMFSDSGSDKKSKSSSSKSSSSSSAVVGNGAETITEPTKTTMSSIPYDTTSPDDEQSSETPTVAQSTKRTPLHTYNPRSVSGMSHDDVDDVCKGHIQSVYVDTMEESTGGYLDDSRYIKHGDYSIFVSNSDTYRIITPADNYGDGKSDRTWYYFDSSDELAFIFAFENHHQYRYYVHNDKVVKLDYREGDSDTRDDAKMFYYDDSNFPTNTDSLISSAYTIRDYVLSQ